MVSPALQQLYDEHEVILAASDRLRSLLESPDLPERSVELLHLLEFFGEYADTYHHKKEEEVLFPALANTNPVMDMLTGSLIEHHTLFREAIANARSAVNAKDWNTVRSVLEKYIGELGDHISAENDELFVAAEDVIEDREKERIYFQFMDCDEELGTERKHEFERAVTNGK